jgi:hypothetical protein
MAVIVGAHPFCGFASTEGKKKPQPFPDRLGFFFARAQ